MVCWAAMSLRWLLSGFWTVVGPRDAVGFSARSVVGVCCEMPTWCLSQQVERVGGADAENRLEIVVLAAYRLLLVAQVSTRPHTAQWEDEEKIGQSHLLHPSLLSGVLREQQ